MALPTPSEFEAIVPVDPDVPTCEELQVLMTELPSLLNRWWGAWFNADGSLTDEFSSAICDLNCDGSSGSSSTDTTPA